MQVEEVGVQEVGVTAVEEEEVMVVGQEGMVVEEAVQEVVPLALSAVRRVTGPRTVHKVDQLGEVEGVTVVEEKEEGTVVEEAVREAVPLASSVVRKVTGPGTVHRVHQVGEVEEGLLGGKAPHRMVEGEVEVLERAISAANQATSAMPAPNRVNTIRRYSTTELLYVVRAMLLQCNLTERSGFTVFCEFCARLTWHVT